MDPRGELIGDVPTELRDPITVVSWGGKWAGTSSGPEWDWRYYTWSNDGLIEASIGPLDSPAVFRKHGRTYRAYLILNDRIGVVCEVGAAPVWAEGDIEEVFQVGMRDVAVKAGDGRVALLRTDDLGVIFSKEADWMSSSIVAGNELLVLMEEDGVLSVLSAAHDFVEVAKVGDVNAVENHGTRLVIVEGSDGVVRLLYLDQEGPRVLIDQVKEWKLGAGGALVKDNGVVRYISPEGAVYRVGNGLSASDNYPVSPNGGVFPVNHDGVWYAVDMRAQTLSALNVPRGYSVGFLGTPDDAGLFPVNIDRSGSVEESLRAWFNGQGQMIFPEEMLRDK